MASIHSRAKPSALGQATHANRDVTHNLKKFTFNETFCILALYTYM